MSVDVGTFILVRNCYKVKYSPYFVVRYASKPLHLEVSVFSVYICPVLYSIHWLNIHCTFREGTRVFN